jgi:hypothetical protein
MLLEESFNKEINRGSRHFFYAALFFYLLIGCCGISNAGDPMRWIDRPREQWPQITMINHIEYADTMFPVAGCSFLLDTGRDTLAVTAKHVLTYFKSKVMKTVSFRNSLTVWKMYPKDNRNDEVIVDTILNENDEESINDVPSHKDWILFSLKTKSKNIQPLTIRTAPLAAGEKVYIIGWRYTDKNCRQRIYEGKYVESSRGTVLISTRELADNKMPGLSGSPVIDSNGDLIGIMSRKAGKMEKLSSVHYPREVLRRLYEKPSN